VGPVDNVQSHFDDALVDCEPGFHAKLSQLGLGQAAGAERGAAGRARLRHAVQRSLTGSVRPYMAIGERSHGVSRRRFLVGGALLAGGVGGAVTVAARLAGGERGHGDPATSWKSAEPDGGLWGDRIPTGGVAPVHASLLPSGFVLVNGIERAEINSFPNFILDPALPGPVRVDPMSVPMRTEDDSLFCAGHSYLADGRMLQVGGQHIAPEVGLDYGLLFNDRGAARGWRVIGPDILGGPAWYPTVTRLASGSMLVISGFTDFGSEENRTIQLFRPSRFDRGQEPWSLLVPHKKAPDVSPTGADYSHVFQLQRPVEIDGHLRQVVMFGKSGQFSFLNYTDRFSDPAARFATRPNAHRSAGGGGAMSAAGASSVILADGRILIVGGGEEGGDGAIPHAHIYDPSRDSWTTLDTGIARSHPAAVLLPDGTVLVVNGDGDSLDDLRKPQIIDPVSEVVLTGPPWSDPRPRGYHNVAVLVSDGRVLTAGGERGGEGSERGDLRYYSPPYLSVMAQRDRPAIVGVPRVMRYGRACTLHFRRGPVHKITLLTLGSMTHSFDQNQRCVVLFEGEAAGEEITITGPKDPFIAPPGHYLLFVMRRIDVSGRAVHVPSVGKVIRVAGEYSQIGCPAYPLLPTMARRG
jgi:galactose oxidase